MWNSSDEIGILMSFTIYSQRLNKGINYLHIAIFIKVLEIVIVFRLQYANSI